MGSLLFSLGITRGAILRPCIIYIFQAWCECFLFPLYWQNKYDKAENMDKVRLLIIDVAIVIKLDFIN